MSVMGFVDPLRCKVSDMRYPIGPIGAREGRQLG